MWLLVIGIGCTGAAVPSLDGGPTDAAGRDTGIEDAPGDTSDPQDETGQDSGGIADDYEHIFSLDAVHAIDIVLSDEALRELRRVPKEYVEGSVVVDGEVFDKVGVHLKGSGSFQDLNGKAAFKIDFNRYDPEQSYHGKGKLTLNNMTQDETQLHEVVAYEAFRAAGLPASRVGYAWITLNGDVYGLYSNVETWDRDFLERNFGNRDGNLYEGGYPLYPDSWDHADFTRQEARNFQLESGTDVAFDDVLAVTDALTTEGDLFELTLSSLVDLDQYARFQILESWTGQWDGYAFASNNFRVFVDHGETGLLFMVPTGLDYCFTNYGGQLNRASSPLGRECQANPDCNQHFSAVLEETLSALDAAELEALMDQASTLIRPYVEDDPRNVVDERMLDRSIEGMRTWIRTQSGQVRRWYE